MITDKDIEKLKKIFVTKEEHQASIERLVKYIDFRIDPVVSSVEELRLELKEFKDQMLKSMDFLIGSYKKFEKQ